MGAVFLYHDLVGFLLEMSPDIVDLVEAFTDGADADAVIVRFAGRFGDADPAEFVDVLVAHYVLVEPDDDDELAGLWPLVAIKARWNAWRRHHGPAGDRLSLWTAWGERPVRRVELDEVDTALWDAFEGDTRLSDLRARFPAERVLGLVRRLVHSDVQALRLSAMPWSAYAKRPQLAPSYLTSTMPYPSWVPGQPVPAVAGGPATPSPTGYYQGEVADADAQFEHQETTLSHLFRIAHPALAGRTYGQALVDGLEQRGALPAGATLRVLEIGAGLGYVARDVLGALRQRGREVEYTIVELAPALRRAQEERLAGAAVRWVAGDVLALDLPVAGFDLVVCNEMVGDLPARLLTRAELGLPADGIGEVDPAALTALGPTGALIGELALPVGDMPAEGYLQTGALTLVGKLAGWLAPGGTAVVTEFGHTTQWPRLSTHLDHPELSTHFGLLQHAARAHGLTATVDFVIDLIDLDRDQRGLATTRSHWRALTALLADAGVVVQKVGYTPDLLDAALAGKVDRADLGDLRFDRIEDRLMGLVPHEFRALLARRGPPSDN